MKIIEVPQWSKPKLQEYICTCIYCGCKFECDSSDITHDDKEHDSFVFCPNCKNAIDSRYLNLKGLWR